MVDGNMEAMMCNRSGILQITAAFEDSGRLKPDTLFTRLSMYTTIDEKTRMLETTTCQRIIYMSLRCAARCAGKSTCYCPPFPPKALRATC